MILGNSFGNPKPFSKFAIKNLALVLGLIAFSSPAFAFYYPPSNTPPNPPPNYNQIDSLEFQGTPTIPLPPPDSGGIYIYRDSGKWNVANHIYSKGNSLEQFHGSILAQMSQPPELGVNVFITDFEFWDDTTGSLCLIQNDRWGWVQWDSTLYEIWWDVTTKEFKAGAQDVNDFMQVRIIGCALDFNVWSSGHGGPFGADQIYLGQSMTRLSDVVGYVDTNGTFVNSPFTDTYSGISDPYQSQAGSDPRNDPNITVFSSKALTGASYNRNGLISTSDSYPCDLTYGQRYTGSFAYEGNGIQFTTSCQEPTNVPPVLIVSGDTTVFLCDPTEICIQLHGEDDDDDKMHLTMLSGAGYFSDYSSDDPFDTLHCFTPDTSGTYCFVFELDDDAFLRGVIESDDDVDTVCVTVIFNTAPAASCPTGDTLIVCDLSQICLDGFSISDPDGNLVSTTVSGGTLTGTEVCFTPVPGDNFITLIGADSCGAADTCQTIVHVILDTPPEPNCPSDITVSNDNGQCGAVVTYSSSVTDDQPGATIVCTPASGSFFPIGTTQVTCTATDACGNTATCSFNVTVNDTEPPPIACPADIAVQCSNDVPAPDVLLVTASDNCPGVIVTFVSDSSDGQTCPETIYRTYKATDASNNFSTCVQIITVDDTIPPVPGNCPTDMTIACDAGFPDTTIVTATDNCDPNPVVTFSETIIPGNCPQEMTIQRKWVVIDACSNKDSCEQTINVVDNVAPTFVDCPASITVECDAIPAPASPTATDNCDPAPVVTYLGETSTPGNCAQEFTLTRKWEAKDACGNADTCSQNINVVDTSPPVFVDCPASITVECDAIPAPASPTANDNCDPNPVITYLGETTTPGSCPQQYTLTRKWEAKDDCDNADTCSQNIIVVDTTPPVITSAPGNVSLQCIANIPPIDPSDITATDNCGNVTVDTNRTTNGGSGCLNDPLVITDTYTVSDDCGNSVPHVRTITAEDNTPPICNIPRDTTIVSCSTLTFCLPVSAVDSCDPNPICTIVEGPGTLANGQWCYQPGPGSDTVQVIFKCTDNCNNSCWDTLDVIFVINTAPTISVTAVTPQVLCNTGDTVCATFSISDPDNGHTVQTALGWINGNQACFVADTPGTYTNTLTVTDSCNLSDDTTYTIDVQICDTLQISPDLVFDGFHCDAFCDSFPVPGLTGGCPPFVWTVNGSPIDPDTVIKVCVPVCTSIDSTWAFVVTDDCGRSATSRVVFTATVNCPPQASCPVVLDDIRVCSLGTVVCIPGDGFACDDIDNNIDSVTLNGELYIPGDPFCFVAQVEGPNTLQLICYDGCNKTATCNATVNIIVDLPSCSTLCPDIIIEKRHDTYQGQYETVSITIENMTYAIGGLDLLIEYDPSALALSSVEPGSFITACGWEYFAYRHGASGNCGSNACPTGKLRLTAIAEVNNGANHPSCFQAAPAEVANLVMLVSNDRTLECQFVPIRFCWYDCGDNTLSTVNGDTLYLSSGVFEYYDGVTYTEITDIAAPFPSLYGANNTCDNTAPEGKLDGIRCINFYNGGVDIVCADSIDLRGDMNLNNLPHEVADVVLFSNYFIYGLSVFTVNLQGQIAASDVNADGAVLTVADLVYMIRIVVGDAMPFSKVVAPVEVTFSHYTDGRLAVGEQAAIGAAYVVVKGESQPVLLADGMEMKYNYDGANTRVLIWSLDGQSFTGDFLQTNDEIISIEMATADGNPAMMTVLPTNFELNQNYPNPFNPTTVISFALPAASDYTLTIYNVNGQVVESIAGSAESAGEIEIEWQAGNYASGVYIYKLAAGSFVDTKKMMLIK